MMGLMVNTGQKRSEQRCSGRERPPLSRFEGRMRNDATGRMVVMVLMVCHFNSDDDDAAMGVMGMISVHG